VTDATKYASLTEAMLAGDALAEAEMRYSMLDDVFREAAPRERKSLSVELNVLMEKIIRLRAQGPEKSQVPPPTGDEEKYGKVVPFDPARFGGGRR
jgi:hypothetical protein